MQLYLLNVPYWNQTGTKVQNVTFLIPLNDYTSLTVVLKKHLSVDLSCFTAGDEVLMPAHLLDTHLISCMWLFPGQTSIDLKLS